MIGVMRKSKADGEKKVKNDGKSGSAVHSGKTLDQMTLEG